MGELCLDLYIDEVNTGQSEMQTQLGCQSRSFQRRALANGNLSFDLGFPVHYVLQTGRRHGVAGLRLPRRQIRRTGVFDTLEEYSDPCRSCPNDTPLGEQMSPYPP